MDPVRVSIGYQGEERHLRAIVLYCHVRCDLLSSEVGVETLAVSRSQRGWRPQQRSLASVRSGYAVRGAMGVGSCGAPLGTKSVGKVTYDDDEDHDKERDEERSVSIREQGAEIILVLRNVVGPGHGPDDVRGEARDQDPRMPPFVVQPNRAEAGLALDVLQVRRGTPLKPPGRLNLGCQWLQRLLTSAALGPGEIGGDTLSRDLARDDWSGCVRVGLCDLLAWCLGFSVGFYDRGPASQCAALGPEKNLFPLTSTSSF